MMAGGDHVYPVLPAYRKGPTTAAVEEHGKRLKIGLLKASFQEEPWLQGYVH